jgi:hypothetical protein
MGGVFGSDFAPARLPNNASHFFWIGVSGGLPFRGTGAIMKRWTVLIGLGLFLCAPLYRAFSAETALKTINVAVPAVSLLQAPLFIAI